MKRIVYYVLFLLLFTTYRTVQHDEMFEQIVNKSCRNAFIVTLLTTAIILFIEMLFPNQYYKRLISPLFSAHSFLRSGSLCSFTINLLMKWKMHHGVRNENKEYRAKLNMTQEDLAKSVGVRRETISHLEKGKYNPSLQLAHDIAEHFKVRLMKFLFLRMNKNTGILCERMPVFIIQLSPIQNRMKYAQQ